MRTGLSRTRPSFASLGVLALAIGLGASASGALGRAPDAAMPSEPQGPAGTADQRTPPLTFGAGIEVINLTVTVTDGQGRLIGGLDRDAFAVYEDGIRQDLSLFNRDRLPLSVVVLIDTSASMEDKLVAAKRAARRFIGTMTESDRTRIVQFNNRITILQDFTNDLKALETGIEQLQASGPTALHNAFYVSIKDLQKEKRAGELKRQAIVLLSDGENTASIVTDEQVVDLARKAEIAIYAIRITAPDENDRGRAAFSQATHLLSVLARETGGQAFFPSEITEIDAVYDRVAEELRSQYSLGYVPANARRDGKWRRIVVRIPARDDVNLRYKLGYFGPRG